MRSIIVDDEPVMLRKFERLSRDFPEIDLVGVFRDPCEALAFAGKEPVDLAFLDIGIPVINGLELAKRLREINKDILIVFITAHDEYIREANQIASDYYLMKPYDHSALEKAVQNMTLLSRRLKKTVFFQTFGHFNVMKNGKPIALNGKAKEILALLVAKGGKELSNEEIFSTIWEEKEYSHAGRKTYFNALRRLKNALKAHEIEEVLISTAHGQMVNPEKFDCDYYMFQEKGKDIQFEGHFLVDYSWSEGILASILEEYGYL